MIFCKDRLKGNIIMEKFLIRYAATGDYNAVEEIMKQVHKLHVDLRPDTYKPVDTVLSYEEFQKAVEQQTFLVAEYGRNVAGILSYLLRHTEVDKQVTRDVLFIDCIAVDEKYRGKGIGRGLLDFAKNIVQEKHLDGFELQVNAKNTNARKMYESYGFVEKSINMELL